MAAPRNSDIRQQILDKTYEILCSRPLNEISLTDIARAANVSKGTLYYYYQSKEDILQDIADLYFEQVGQGLVQLLAVEARGNGRSAVLRDILLRSFIDKSGSLRINLIGAAIAGNEQLQQRLHEHYGMLLGHIEERICARYPKADAHRVASGMLCLIDGFILHRQLQVPDIDPDLTLDYVAGQLEMLLGEAGNIE